MVVVFLEVVGVLKVVVLVAVVVLVVVLSLVKEVVADVRAAGIVVKVL